MRRKKGFVKRATRELINLKGTGEDSSSNYSKLGNKFSMSATKIQLY